MCGLSGYLGGHNGGEKTLTLMMNSLIHRGPDDSGIWIDETAEIGISHRRLSILDLSSAGYQPMISHSGRYVIVFNGEIYNHLDLAKVKRIKFSRSLRY